MAWAGQLAAVMVAATRSRALAGLDRSKTFTLTLVTVDLAICLGRFLAAVAHRGRCEETMLKPVLI